MKVKMCALALSMGLVLAGNVRAELVVVANKASQVAKLSAEQVSDCYLGKSTDFLPVDQEKSSPLRHDFLEKVASKKEAQYEALWAKLEFSGKGIRPKALPSDAAVKKAVAADPNAIGYIDKAAVDPTVKVVFTLP